MSHETELRQILASQTRLSVASVGLDDDLVRELGIDSLTALRLLAAVEKRFDMRIPDERLDGLRTLRQVLELLAEEEES